jgi:hypothetical protein
MSSIIEEGVYWRDGVVWVNLPIVDELYPEVVDACEEEGGVPSRLTKTDRLKAGKEGTPCQMFAGSSSGRTTKVASRSMISRGRAHGG